MSNFTTSDSGTSSGDGVDALSSQDYYSILGVSRQATKDEIKRSFKKLAITFHPDKFQQDPAQQEEAQARFKEIKDAYDVLISDQLRTIYDDFGAEAVKKQKTMQVGKVVKSNQEFLRDMFRMRRAQHQDYIMRRVDHTGSFMVMVSPANAPRGDYRPELGTISVRQYIKFPLTAVSHFRLGFTALISAHQSKGTMKMAYQHTLPAIAAAVNWSLRLSWTGYSARVSVFRQIYSDLQGDVAFTLEDGTPTLKLLLAKRLGDRWQGDCEAWLTRGAPALRLAIGTRPDLPGTHVDGSVHLKRGSIESQAKVHYNWSDRTKLGLEAGVDVAFAIFDHVAPSGQQKRRLKIVLPWFVAGFAERTISQLTKANVGFTIAPHGVFVTPGITRHGQTFSMPIMLNHFPTLGTSLVAVLAPLVIGFILESIILEPRRRRKRMAQEEKRKAQQEAQVAAAKTRAQADCRLMADEVNRKRETEESKGGLVILQAFYGRLPDPNAQESLDLDADEERSDRIDVTLPLQYMVQNSQLQIASGTTKAAFIGFYDPIPDEEKFIEVVYLYRQKTHHVVVADTDSLRLPLKSHQMDI